MNAFVAAGFRPVDTTNFALGSRPMSQPLPLSHVPFSEATGRFSGNLLGSASLNTLHQLASLTPCATMFIAVCTHKPIPVTQQALQHHAGYRLGPG